MEFAANAGWVSILKTTLLNSLRIWTNGHQIKSLAILEIDWNMLDKAKFLYKEKSEHQNLGMFPWRLTLWSHALLLTLFRGWRTEIQLDQRLENLNFLCKARCWKTFTLLCHVGLTAFFYFDQQTEVGRYLIDLDEILLFAWSWRPLAPSAGCWRPFPFWLVPKSTCRYKVCVDGDVLTHLQY